MNRSNGWNLCFPIAKEIAIAYVGQGRSDNSVTAIFAISEDRLQIGREYGKIVNIKIKCVVYV